MIRVSALLFSLIVFLSNCEVKSSSHDDDLDIYNTALDQIITEYLRGHCLREADVEFIEKIHEAVGRGEIDSSRYFQVGDSLYANQLTQGPKCIIEYSPLFGTTQGLTTSDLQTSMNVALQDNFFKKYFSASQIDKVIDTLCQSTTVDWKNISLSNMNLIAHDTVDHKHRYGNTGIGVIALSKIYYNTKTDHAILFFEFKSSGHFQRGEVVFLEKEKDHWKVVDFQNIWIA